MCGERAHIGDILETDKRAVKPFGVDIRAAAAIEELSLELPFSERQARMTTREANVAAVQHASVFGDDRQPIVETEGRLYGTHAVVALDGDLAYQRLHVRALHIAVIDLPQSNRPRRY